MKCNGLSTSEYRLANLRPRIAHFVVTHIKKERAKSTEETKIDTPNTRKTKGLTPMDDNVAGFLVKLSFLALFTTVASVDASNARKVAIANEGDTCPDRQEGLLRQPHKLPTQS